MFYSPTQIYLETFKGKGKQGKIPVFVFATQCLQLPCKMLSGDTLFHGRKQNFTVLDQAASHACYDQTNGNNCFLLLIFFFFLPYLS